MDNYLLSIIIPAHNEEKRLPETLARIADFLHQQKYQAEVIVVENGSTDRTFEIAERYANENPNFYAVHETARGKGLAVRRGMLETRGEYRFMCDADLSMPIDQLNRFIPPSLTGYDIAIASREGAGAVRYKEPAYRHIGGRLVNTLIRWLALPGLQDTQCGFKCFRAEIAEELFPLQTMQGWSFDIEILYIARMRGYQIVELPIPWYYNPESKVNAVRDALKMALDILKIRKNKRQRLYG